VGDKVDQSSVNNLVVYTIRSHTSFIANRDNKAIEMVLIYGKFYRFRKFYYGIFIDEFCCFYTNVLQSGELAKFSYSN